MTEPRWLDAREARLWQSYRDAYRELMRALESRLIGNSGLSGADYALLHPLSVAEEGVLRTRDLGRSVGWERSRLSHQVSRMEKRGLVTREPCPTDQRGAVIVITGPGGDLIRAAAPQHVSDVRDVFVDHLTAAELETLVTIGDKVRARLARAEQR